MLVISPHPDDDVIGCGGSLQRFARRGARIAIVYVTDGSASHLKSKRFPPPVLRDLREREARAALEALGVRAKVLFLRAPDGGLASLEPARQSALAAAVARAIDRLRVDVLLTPWHRDPHPDHVATAALVARARRIASRRPTALMYGVWLPVRGTPADAPADGEVTLRELTLTAAEVEHKRAAILAHRSQAGDLIDDDPEGFHIDRSLLETWLTPLERFYTQRPGSFGVRAEDDRRP